MNFKTLILIVAACATSACASAPKTLEPVPHGAAIAHQVVIPAELKQPSASNGGTAAKHMAGGAAVGIGAGAAYGAAMGLGCGPWLVFCSPVLAVGGAMGGAAVGLGAGTYEAAMRAIPGEKADALNEIIANTFAEKDFAALIEDEFEDRSGGRWVVTDEAPVAISITLTQIGLSKEHNDLLTIKTVIAVQVLDNSGAKLRVQDRVYPVTSFPYHIDELLENDGENFRLSIEDNIARAMHDLTVEMAGY